MTIFRNNVKGFHLELTNKCTLKCPACPRTEMINKFSKYWTNNDLNFEELKNFLDIDISGFEFFLCGNYGDPIYYDDLIPLCQWLKSKNANIKIVTNGSYQKVSFWTKLANILTDQDEIIWSIDGIPENFTQYRINADWNSIKTGIEIISKTNIKTAWKYIVFNFNQNDINTADELAKSLGIQKFTVIKSDRWTNISQMKPDDKFVSYKHEIRTKKSNNAIIEISPDCNNGMMHFISCEGYYTPCCFVGIHKFYYKSPWGHSKTRENFKIANTTFTEIQNNSITIDFEKDIESNNLDVCKFNCPKQNV